MNSWHSRIALAFVAYAASRIHAMSMHDLPSAEVWGAVYFGSAMTVDWALLKICPAFTAFKLCDFMQYSCIASIVINTCGFLWYMQGDDPWLYNKLIAILSIIQAIRLLLIDRHDTNGVVCPMEPNALGVRA